MDDPIGHISWLLYRIETYHPAYRNHIKDVYLNDPTQLVD